MRFISEMTNEELMIEMKRLSKGCHYPDDINPCYTCKYDLTDNECKDCVEEVIEEITDELENKNIDWEESQYAR